MQIRDDAFQRSSSSFAFRNINYNLPKFLDLKLKHKPPKYEYTRTAA